ncbi:MAG: hypothetical protein AAF211_28435 [Myxococcota bacterium]
MIRIGMVFVFAAVGCAGEAEPSFVERPLPPPVLPDPVDLGGPLEDSGLPQLPPEPVGIDGLWGAECDEVEGVNGLPTGIRAELNLTEQDDGVVVGMGVVQTEIAIFGAPVVAERIEGEVDGLNGEEGLLAELSDDVATVTIEGDFASGGLEVELTFDPGTVVTSANCGFERR